MTVELPLRFYHCFYLVLEVSGESVILRFFVVELQRLCHKHHLPTFCNCNCNYTLFTKLPWPEDSEGTFRSSSQAATCPPVYHTRWRLHTVPLIAERQAGKL